MSSSFPPFRLSGPKDQDTSVPPALESGVRSVPEKLAEDFSLLARGIEIHVRQDVGSACPIEIYDARGVCVSDPEVEEFDGVDPEIDAAQEQILARLAEYGSGLMDEDALLAAVDMMLAADKAVQERQKRDRGSL